MDIAQNPADQRGPLLIGAGLTIVLTAQLLSAIPLATAISLIGLGAMLTIKHHRNQLLLALNFAIYASLVALAITAQTNLHNNLLVQCDAILAIVLIVIAIPRMIYALE
jgi:hypothetical protein